jgi:hypothetical protein
VRTSAVNRERKAPVLAPPALNLGDTLSAPSSASASLRPASSEMSGVPSIVAAAAASVGDGAGTAAAPAQQKIAKGACVRCGSVHHHHALRWLILSTRIQSGYSLGKRAAGAP